MTTKKITPSNEFKTQFRCTNVHGAQYYKSCGNKTAIFDTLDEAIKWASEYLNKAPTVGNIYIHQSVVVVGFASKPVEVTYAS